MAGEDSRIVAVCGATGRQGGAVARSVLRRGWHVRALTRKPQRADALARLGAEVVRADMNDPASLRAAFDGAHGVYSVQNGMISGFDREVAQGRAVADAAKACGVAHLVFGSASKGIAGTGVPSWETKVVIEDHIRSLDLPYTMLRPTAFMELMTDKKFYPAVGTWRIWPKLTGETRPIPWLAVDDLGEIAAIAFERPDEFAGKELMLAADLQSLAQCRAIYEETMGKKPPSFPMPQRLFDTFTRNDVTTMWRWLRDGELPVDTATVRSILPSAMSVRDWLARQRDHERG
ncbi:MAG TPA: NmrA/HSCARG family protein [Actinomycetota bacterium]|nr:NmrA/HSCARG family protein [Actinomycetota bacterium]